MDILFIEPFYSGSHKTWLDQFKKHSTHNISLMTMDGKSWKWRMYGASITMADKMKTIEKTDLIITSDMLDLAAFISFSRHELHRLGNPKIGLYCHENQLAYPWRPEGDDRKQNRDVHYGMINYTSALSADFIMFNSDYNRSSFVTELDQILKKMPDYQHKSSIQQILDKSTILPIGFETPVELTTDQLESVRVKYGLSEIQQPLILWNHRLDHDKNPELFLRTLIHLKDQGLSFKLAFLGEMNTRNLNRYGFLLEELKEKTVAMGYLDYENYLAFLHLADILPVTSNHDFFGISVMEAIAYGCSPILPDRLTYPDLYKIHENPDLFYETEEELIEKLADRMNNIQSTRQADYIHLTEGYQWKNLIPLYDAFISDIC